MHKDLAKYKELFDSGENLIEYFKSQSVDNNNSSLAIAVSYDLQAGNYIRKAKINPEYEHERSVIFSSILNQLGNYKSILEVGVGEATTFGGILPNLTNEILPFGFDISYSRIKYGMSFLSDLNINNAELYVGDMFHAPFQNDSMDVVYTIHTLEPNGGREKEVLQELYRVTKNYLVLFEPIYEMANENAKKHIDQHGYVKNLYEHAIELGYKVTEYKLLFGDNTFSHNNTGVIIIQKSNDESNEMNKGKLACPISKKPLELVRGSYYCRESMLVYPVVDQVPCLQPSNAIIATHYLDDFKL